MSPAPVALRVEAARVRAGLSRRDLAATAGLARSTVYRIERRNQKPDFDTVKALAGALHVRAHELLAS